MYVRGVLGFTVIKVISAGAVGCSIHLVETVTDWATVLPMLSKDLPMLPVISLISCSPGGGDPVGVGDI